MMFNLIRSFVLAFGLWVVAIPVWATQISIDSAAARAVLAALQNPSLTHEEALKIAELPGNQGLVKKAVSYHVPATTESFAEALVSAAHGVATQSEATKAFRLEQLKPAVATLLALLDRIDGDPGAFKDWVVHRVAQFSPPLAGADITGYLVVGGSSGGFAFDDSPGFFLNLGYFKEFDAAKVVMAHELYHAIQGVFAKQQVAWWNQKKATQGGKAALAKQCTALAQLFTDLYQEGSASYVGDPFLLTGDLGPIAKKTLDDMANGIKGIAKSTTLLELSVIGVSAKQPVAYEAVYELGFYGPEILYRISYVMARAIAQDRGGQALAQYLSQPGYVFADAYVALPRYGKDGEHPALGPNTVQAIGRLKAGCR